MGLYLRLKQQSSAPASGSVVPLSYRTCPVDNLVVTLTGELTVGNRHQKTPIAHNHDYVKSPLFMRVSNDFKVGSHSSYLKTTSCRERAGIVHIKLATAYFGVGICIPFCSTDKRTQEKGNSSMNYPAFERRPRA